MRGERATLDAVGTHRPQRRHDKLKGVPCHAQDHPGPLVGPVGEHVPDPRPSGQDALTGHRDAIAGPDRAHVSHQGQLCVKQIRGVLDPEGGIDFVLVPLAHVGDHEAQRVLSDGFALDAVRGERVHLRSAFWKFTVMLPSSAGDGSLVVSVSPIWVP
jgi:hypothetical protein